MAAIIVLADLASNYDQPVPHLVNALQDSDPRIKAISARAFRRIGQSGIPAKLFLDAGLEDSDIFVRIEADFALSALIPGRPRKYLNAIEDLVRLLQSADMAARARAAELLGSLGREAISAVPALIEAMADKRDWSVTARLALEGIAGNDESVITTLTQTLQTHYHPSVRADVASILLYLGATARPGTAARGVLVNVNRALADKTFPRREILLGERSNLTMFRARPVSSSPG